MLCMGPHGVQSLINCCSLVAHAAAPVRLQFHKQFCNCTHDAQCKTVILMV
jgi:hypothetical protein